jgi:hypothetical protein
MATALVRPLEKLNLAFVFLRGLPRAKGAQIFAFAGLGVRFARIETVVPTFQFANHKLKKSKSCATNRPLSQEILMNELEFKRHLKDLAHGHHRPEEHDWADTPASASSRKTKTAAKPVAARKRSQKPSKKK